MPPNNQAALLIHKTQSNKHEIASPYAIKTRPP